MDVRLATKSDFKKVVDIYNQVIKEGGIIGYSAPFAYKDLTEWFNEHLNSKYPLFVAEIDNEVIGWVSISPYRKGRDLLNRTCVVSYFITKLHRGQGIGSALLKIAVEEARNLGFKTMLAIVFAHNSVSVKLLEKYKFKRWAFLPGIAEYNCKILNHVYYGLSL